MYQTVPVIDFSQFKALRSVSFCTYSSSRNGSRHQKIASSVSTIRVPHAVEIYIADKYFQLPSSDDNLRWLYGKNREEW
ncbi:hypothetical protein Moror_17823 [Moniliophthora roreri MCA 2997]|nr:hypothetical protein Moror_17823 [Moniliophthora roreri MCA 2997]